MKILIVDDDEDMVRIIRNALKNHDCFSAYDARQASEIISKEYFDLVITDINMPHGGGERTLRELAHRPTRVFVYTGHYADFDKYKKLGADKVFLKGDLSKLIISVDVLGQNFKKKQRIS